MLVWFAVRKYQETQSLDHCGLGFIKFFDIPSISGVIGLATLTAVAVTTPIVSIGYRGASGCRPEENMRVFPAKR